MKKLFLLFGVVVVVIFALLLADVRFSSAQTVDNTTWGRIKAQYHLDDSSQHERMGSGVGTMATYTGDWSSYVLSEEFYTLNVYRSGTSNCVYQGMAMSDWPQTMGYTYPRSDASALDIVSRYIGTDNVGTIDGTWNGGCSGRGGYCKFFVDLVLYRSSYGIGNGWHLVLPSGTDPSDYSQYMAPYDVKQARPGWILQRGGSIPHTALVAANLGWGLDLIDSNNVAYNGSFVIARHAFSWDQLRAYTAFRPTYMRQVVNGRLQ